MAKPCNPLVLLAFLAVSQDSYSKSPKPPLRIFGRLLMNVDFYQQCPDATDIAMFANNTRVRMVDNIVVMDADHYCARLIPNIEKTVIKFFNCKDRASGECPLFQTWRFGKESCAMPEMKGQLWSPFFESVTPRFKCPNAAPGVYRLRNGTINMRVLESIPFPWEKYYWRIRTEIYDSTMFYCTEGAGQYLRTRA